MNPTGTKTASSTSVIAMIGPVISFIASLVASLAGSPVAVMTRSTFSTTTMASSTTMPTARIMAKSEIVFAEYPMASSTANVPISDTGTAMAGMRVARRFPRKTNTTTITRAKASSSVLITSWMDDDTKTVVS